METWKLILLLCICMNVMASCVCCLMMSAGGGYVATNPSLQATLWVATMTPNAKNVYSYYSNVTSNVSCLSLAANLSFVSDQSGATAISSGSCPSGKTAAGPMANGQIVCNPENLMSNAAVLASFNSWSACEGGPAHAPAPVPVIRTPAPAPVIRTPAPAPVITSHYGFDY